MQMIPNTDAAHLLGASLFDELQGPQDKQPVFVEPQQIHYDQFEREKNIYDISPYKPPIPYEKISLANEIQPVQVKRNNTTKRTSRRRNRYSSNHYRQRDYANSNRTANSHRPRKQQTSNQTKLDEQKEKQRSVNERPKRRKKKIPMVSAAVRESRAARRASKKNSMDSNHHKNSYSSISSTSSDSQNSSFYDIKNITFENRQTNQTNKDEPFQSTNPFAAFIMSDETEPANEAVSNENPEKKLQTGTNLEVYEHHNLQYVEEHFHRLPKSRQEQIRTIRGCDVVQIMISAQGPSCDCMMDAMERVFETFYRNIRDGSIHDLDEKIEIEFLRNNSSSIRIVNLPREDKQTSSNLLESRFFEALKCTGGTKCRLVGPEHTELPIPTRALDMAPRVIQRFIAKIFYDRIYRLVPLQKERRLTKHHKQKKRRKRGRTRQNKSS